MHDRRARAMSNELKLCPFCGSGAEVVTCQGGVQCLNCAAYSWTVEEWNQRASPWIKCEERLPKMCDFPILIRPTAQKSIIYIFYRLNFNRSDFAYIYEWMPIPEM